MKSESHELKVKSIRERIEKYRKERESKEIRFYHGGTNSTRTKETDNYYIIDTSNLNEIISIDKKNKMAIVEPNVSMKNLLKATQKLGLMPFVVPEFPEITVGGAIQGAALESSSFKYGQFNDNCVEYEIIDGSGRILTANTDKHSDLFYAVSGSYGSFGVLTKIKLKLKPLGNFVKISIDHYDSKELALETIEKNTQKNIDFLEGIIYGENKVAIITGKLTNGSNEQIIRFSRKFDEWYYLFVEKQMYSSKKFLVPIDDYLFRYNRGAFWMGDYSFKIMRIPFGSNRLSRAIFDNILKTKNLYRGMHLSNYSHSFFIQDIYFTFDGTKKYLDFASKDLKIYPIWLCPIKSTKSPQKLSPHYQKKEMLLNIGIWGQSRDFLSNYLLLNKKAENITISERGRKMLYAHQFYTEDKFWGIYDKIWYNKTRKSYSSEIFPGIYSKTHVKDIAKPEPIKGFLKFFFSTSK